MPVRLAADLCVAGGGMAGVCAALAAARRGARVALVQDRSVLGGNASSEVRMHISGASCSGKRPGARESGIIDELRVEDSVRNPDRRWPMFDLLLYDKVASEPGITLLLDTACTGCEVDGGFIRRVRALRCSTEDEFEIEAPFYADCSGDGRLGKEAGADFRVGREARGEFGEPHAVPEADAKTLGSTILFSASRKDGPRPFAAPAWARRFTAADLRLRSHREREFGYWWVEWGGELDTIRDNAGIRHELLRIALGVWDHVKNGCRCQEHGAAYDKWLEADAAAAPALDARNWSLDWIGMLPGKRESRRFLGPHVLTENDVAGGRIFEDEVAYGGWWLDLHPPAGVDAVGEYPCTQIDVPHLYSIPLRALYSRNIHNLFFAGRNISATHVAQASTRVMATCALTGQAVGTAAALACQTGLARAADLAGAPHLGRLQQWLIEDDMFLLAARGTGERDLARTAAIRASSEAPGHAAAQVANGLTRATAPRFHPSLPECSNQWRAAALPAWIELAWPEPVTIREIQITFDTGFERELALSLSDAFTARMIRGPQPETVADYDLICGGTVTEVRGNYLRKRRHALSRPVIADSVRLAVRRTHGDPAARVFEIRAY
ncbi:MAG: FAD-dependent oxidoreductase [Bryobacteraceae bacterium]